jgi:hypothetical protein
MTIFHGQNAAVCAPAILLVDGDPSVNIGDTLSIRAAWRQGTQLAVELAGARA